MKLELQNTNFAKNIGFYAKMTRKCMVCDSTKIHSNNFGVSCESCGTRLKFDENRCNLKK